MKQKMQAMLTGVFAGLALTAVSAFATEIRPIHSNGSSTGQCGSTTYYSCVDGLEGRAEQDAAQGAYRECSSFRGTLQGAPYCSTYCNPTVPPPAGFAMVTCQANCQSSCRIE